MDIIELIPVRSGLCTSSQLGGFITSFPTDMRLNDTSIYTTPLKFTEGSFPTPNPSAEDQSEEEPIPTPEGSGEILEEGEILDNMERFHKRGKRRWDIIESITNGVKGASPSESEDATLGTEGGGDGEGSGERQDEGGAVYEVPTYSGAVHYKVPKTGYYCVGTSLSIQIISLLSFSFQPSTHSFSTSSHCTSNTITPRWKGNQADVQESYLSHYSINELSNDKRITLNTLEWFYLNLRLMVNCRLLNILRSMYVPFSPFFLPSFLLCQLLPTEYEYPTGPYAGTTLINLLPAIPKLSHICL